jgi:hypothetical protein
MLASLAAFVFAYFRRELLYGEGLPYGAVSGVLQFKEFNFLYPPRTLGCILCRVAESEEKVDAYHPSSCLYTPWCLGWPFYEQPYAPTSRQVGRWRNHFLVEAKTDVLLPNTTDSFPSVEHCNVDTGDAACPHGDWELISQHLLSYWPRLEPMGDMPEIKIIQLSLHHRVNTSHISGEWSSTSYLQQNDARHFERQW